MNSPKAVVVDVVEVPPWMTEKLKCKHCGRLRHTKDTCRDLHSRPQQDKQGRSQCGGLSDRVHT